jgi:hypothetical protein
VTLLATAAAMALPLVAVSAQAQASTHTSHASYTAVARATTETTAAPAAAPRALAGGWGYVSQGNLRTNPNLNAPTEVTIYNQWVNILCWIDGGNNGFGSNRWFKTQYYSLVDYLSSGVVSHQPIVGQC